VLLLLMLMLWGGRTLVLQAFAAPAGGDDDVQVDTAARRCAHALFFPRSESVCSRAPGVCSCLCP